MADALAAAAEWAAREGPPNLVFILALLTSPARWSRWARDRLDQWRGDGS